MPALFSAALLALAAAQEIPTPAPAIDAPVQIDAPPAPVTTTEELERELPPSEEILVLARPRHPPGDPFEGINIKTFEIMQKVDDKLVAPVADVYDSMPEPVRNGLHNFLKNLGEPVVVINFFLQHKIGKSAETLARFTLNSTVGVVGLFDIAKRKPFHLPRRPNGFGDTLGFYGVPQGPYLFLPVIGPSTVRDLVGVFADRLVLPAIVGGPFKDPLYTIPAGAISVFDRRSEFDDELKEVRASSNPYARRRDEYLRHRQAEIDALHVHHRKKPATP